STTPRRGRDQRIQVEREVVDLVLEVDGQIAAALRMPQVECDGATARHLVDESCLDVGKPDRATEAHGGIITATGDDATSEHVGQEGGVPLNPREGLSDALLRGEPGDQALRNALEHVHLGTRDDERRIVPVADIIARCWRYSVPLSKL